MENKYVVYTHIDSNGNIRYIGSGSLQRANMNHANTNRGEDYKNFVLTYGKLDVSILFSGLSKVESLKIEKELYDQYKTSGLLLNFSKPRVLSIIIDDDILSNFEYSTESPSGLVWKIGKQNLGCCGVNTNHKQAGGLNKNKYWIVKFKNRSLKVHRIIFRLLNPDVNIDNLVIDHIDRNPSNNCAENLRAVSYAENTRNRGSKVKELPIGVMWKEKQGLYTAHYCDPSRTYSNGAPYLVQKHFNVNKIGSHEEALRLAIEWRQNALIRLNSEQKLGYLFVNEKEKYEL